ncbi:hypothetical protein JOM56_001743 [Amanita muscaria]
MNTDSIDDARSGHSMSNSFGSITAAVLTRPSFMPASSEQLEEASFSSMKIAIQASCLPLASILASASFVWSKEQASARA